MLFALVIVRIDLRLFVRTNFSTRPTVECIARQVTEAFPWDEAPKYLMCDRDGACDHAPRWRFQDGDPRSINGASVTMAKLLY